MLPRGTHGRKANPLPVLIVGVAVIGSNSLVLSPILADVAASLHTSVTTVARAIAAYGGATALSALLLGASVDRIGPQRALIVGLLAVTLGVIWRGMLTPVPG